MKGFYHIKTSRRTAPAAQRMAREIAEARKRDGAAFRLARLENARRAAAGGPALRPAA